MNNEKQSIAGLLIAAATLFLSACSSNNEVPQVGDQDTYISDAELSQRSFDCISAAGFEGTLDLSNAQGPKLKFEVSPDRRAAFDQTYQECHEQLVKAGLARPTQRATPEQLKENYQYLLESASCLRENGVQPPDPPSLETFIESGGFAWVPHSAIGEQISDIEAMNEVFRACPQLPQ